MNTNNPFATMIQQIYTAQWCSMLNNKVINKQEARKAATVNDYDANALREAIRIHRSEASAKERMRRQDRKALSPRARQKRIMDSFADVAKLVRKHGAQNDPLRTAAHCLAYLELGGKTSTAGRAFGSQRTVITVSLNRYKKATGIDLRDVINDSNAVAQHIKTIRAKLEEIIRELP